MEVQLEQTGQFGRKLSITIPSDEVDSAFDEVAKEVAKDANIPGFRPGKIPRGVLEQHYGQQIKSEVRERLVESSLVSAMQDKKLSPIGAPHLHVETLERGAVFSYTAEFEVQPEITLKNYKGLKVPKIKVEVAEGEIENTARDHAHSGCATRAGADSRHRRKGRYRSGRLRRQHGRRSVCGR